MRRNAAGETLQVEILNDSQAFDRVINPYIENLRALGVDAVHTRIDNAQLTERERNHDFDMVVGNFRTQLTPGPSSNSISGPRAPNSRSSTLPVTAAPPPTP